MHQHELSKNQDLGFQLGTKGQISGMIDVSDQVFELA